MQLTQVFVTSEFKDLPISCLWKAWNYFEDGNFIQRLLVSQHQFSTFLLPYKKNKMNERKELIGRGTRGYSIYNFVISKFKVYEWNIK